MRLALAAIAGLVVGYVSCPTVVVFRFAGPGIAEPLPAWSAIALGVGVFGVVLAIANRRRRRRVVVEPAPSDDVRDVRGRVLRLGLSVLVGASAGVVTFGITLDSHHNHIGWGLYRFTPVVSLVVAVIAFTVALVAANTLARRKPRPADLPRAWLVAR